MKVLILGDTRKATLSLIRSLGKEGISLDLLYFNPKTICTKSKYIDNKFFIRGFDEFNSGWKEQFKKIIPNYELIIPTDDKFIIPIWKNFDEFKAGNFALPNKRGIEYTFNKVKTIEMAKKLKIPIPHTNIISAFHGKLGKTNNMFVKKSNDRFIVQEYIYGDIIGQEFITKNGKIINSFQHLRLHQPLEGGGSCYRKSMPIDKKILEYSKKMIKFMNYTGVLMFEYKYLPHTKIRAKLLEINGRLWGSLPLAIKCGVNFPLNLYQLYTGKQLTKYNYKENIYCRNIVEDVNFLLSNLSGKESEYSYPLWKCLWEFKNILLLKERWDTFDMEDLKPFFFNLYKKIKQIFKLTILLLIKPFNMLFMLKLPRSENIMFVCHGNVCRSAFAEKYAKKILNKRIKSSGIRNIKSRNSPDRVIRLSKVLGIDLSEHKSKVFNPDIDEKTLVIVFDLSNYFNVIKSDLRLINRTVLLSSFDERFEEIESYGSKERVFSCFEKIKRCVGRMNELDEFHSIE